MLRDANLPRLALLDFGIDRLHEWPSVCQVVPWIVVVAVDVANPPGSIPAQAVRDSLSQPAARVVENVVPYFRPSVIKPCVTPRSRASPIVVKVDSAFTVLAPPVELPHIPCRVAQVVINNVHDHGDSTLVCLLHECTEPVRSAIMFLDCEDVSWVVSPRSIALEFSAGHYFDRINPEVLQVIELRRGRIESAARSRQGLVKHKC